MTNNRGKDNRPPPNPHPHVKQRRKKGGGGRRNAHFMDVAMQAYVRRLAILAWQDVQERMEAHGMALGPALADVGDFSERGIFRDMWRRWWHEIVLEPMPGWEAEGTHPLGPIEAALAQSVLEEQEARAADGMPTIEDTSDYQGFIGRAMGNLLEEASGELEEFD